MQKTLLYLSLICLLAACTPAGEISPYTDYATEAPRAAMPPPPPPAPAAAPEMYGAEEMLDMEAPAVGDAYDRDGTEPISDRRRQALLPENDFQATARQPVSTFSIDADGASYANARHAITNYGGRANPGSIRVEEFINYFDLNYPVTDGAAPISLNGEVSGCPWAPEHRLVRVGIQGRNLRPEEKPAANFVFLVDVSGSMSDPNKLPLLQKGLQLFVDQMSDRDRVAIVTYAGNAGLALPSTSGRRKDKIRRAITGLGSGGGTAGAAGIITAYEIASQHFIPGGNNRILVGTDGDFNIGPSSHEEIIALIETKRETGIFLSVLGFGDGYNDHMLEQLANKGNGTAEYVDNLNQLRKVFIYDYDKFYTVAKDVKVQVRFNPEVVASYRLIGYENRMLNNEDFLDDAKDAGEIGAGQNVTALYEIAPVNNRTVNGPAFTVDFRYKDPHAIISQPLQLEVRDRGATFTEASRQHQFVAGVASFAMQLRGSRYSGTATLEDAKTWTMNAGISDQHGFVQELWSLMDLATAPAR